MKKKVLLVNKMYYPNIGGIETIVKQYAEYLSLSYEVSVLTACPNLRFHIKYLETAGVKIIRCPSFGLYFSMPISLTFIYKILRIRSEYDIIHFHEPFPIASLISVFKKKGKYIITWHSDIIKQKNLKKLIEIFQRKLCAKADIILTTSPDLINFSRILSEFKAKTHVLPLSIDLDEYSVINLQPTEEYILYIGRLSYYKGITVLLGAYEKSSCTIPLYIVGNGEQKIIKEIKEFQERSKKKIIFINSFVSEKEKKEYLQGCRYLLFPSILPSEAFGIIQLEAMVFKKPVINTSLPTGVPWVSINKKTGITVPENNIDELKKAIDILLDDDYVNKLGKEARKRVEMHFSNKIVLKNLLQHYNNLL